MLVWLAVTFVWLPVFSKWPDSIAAKSLTIIWGLGILVLAFARVAGILASWAKLLLTLCTLLPKHRGKGKSPAPDKLPASPRAVSETLRQDQLGEDAVRRCRSVFDRAT